MLQLSDLNGIGPAAIDKLKQLNIESVLDLLFHLPLRYENKTCITPIDQVRSLQPALVEGVISKSFVIQGKRPILVCEIADDSSSMQLKFFNFYYSQKIKMRSGKRIRAYGEVNQGMHGPEMIHPEFWLDKDIPPLSDRLTAIYPKSEGLPQKRLQNAVQQALNLLQSGQLDMAELLPKEWLSQARLPDLQTALKDVHQPPPDVDMTRLMSGRHPSQERLKIEEMVSHFLALQAIRERHQQQQAPQLFYSAAQKKQFLDRLPFVLTGAQQRVLQEIATDLSRQIPMQRLIQGDVGSGKTVVAAGAIDHALANGQQAVLMAPTSILAEQHRLTLTEYFPDIDIAFLSGRLNAQDRREQLAKIAGDARIIIGTHALFQDEVLYRDLALVIIDEQHRFGVHQRLSLKNKGADNNLMPHTLIMTATPIPRTLAQVVYANLDVSVIDELPPNRQVINTVLLDNQKMPQLAERIKAACQRGEQAYWVCTLVEESEHLRAKAAADTYEELKAWFPHLNIGLVHGRLKNDEKAAVMAAFKDGGIQLLVATTVIEVGVDVPNATLMVIENAERLGLSQLHQLRGRVGRGSRQSHCVLMYQSPLSQNAQIRLSTMRDTNDGFEIAKIDLKLRGPGEILGTRQKGAMQFRLVNLETDKDLFLQAKNLAQSMQKSHPKQCRALIHRWQRQAATLAKV
ncbi:MAG: ATP-dependent DNA helicase RecG [Proteobacteria bacterium]|nr:MAG: ATP-dependent DNA helicase RecG [Pseudomonadota bacterium]